MTELLKPAIADIAVYLPDATLDNNEVAARFGIDRDFLDTKLGIEQRHIAAEDEAVSDMAVAAAETLLGRSGVPRDEVGLVVLCTQNPDYRLPATANILQDRLNLPTTCAAFDFNQGCSGYVYGLSIVQALMQANAIEAALLMTAEAYSKVMDPGDRNTVPIFGDGATATLVTATGKGAGRIGRFVFGSDGSGADDLIVKAGGSRNPGMACEGDGALRMNGRAIFNFMMKRVPTNLDQCLAVNGLGREDIDLFVFHQASRYMVTMLSRRMGLDSAKVPIALTDCGNTVSSTLPIVMHSLGGVPALTGKRVLLSGFGVGLSWASTVLTFR
jgi:3-oxoacyl-[acyl-carrier-protein] synthase-3